MSYLIGPSYRYAASMKNGLPVYQTTTVVQVHACELVLPNDKIVDYVLVDTKAADIPVDPRQAWLAGRRRSAIALNSS